MEGNGHESACCECPPGAVCPIGEASLPDNLALSSGYWRASPESIQVLSCQDSLACPGSRRGNVTGNGLCGQPAYEGPLCSQCASLHFRDPVTQTCEACVIDTTSIDRFVQAIAIILIVVLLLLAQLTQCSERVAKYYELLVASKNYAVVWLITWQIMASLSVVHQARGGMGYPILFQNLVNALAMLVTLDLFEVLHADCLVDRPDFTYKLYAGTLIPLGLAALILLVEGVWTGYIKRNGGGIGRVGGSSVTGGVSSGGGGSDDSRSTVQLRLINFDTSKPMGWVRGGGAGGWSCIEKVVPSKQAEAVGVEVGWKIVAVDGAGVSSAAEFAQASKNTKDRAARGGSSFQTVTFAVP